MKRKMLLFVIGLFVIGLRWNFFINTSSNAGVLLLSDGISEQLHSCIYAELVSFLKKDSADCKIIESIIQTFPLVDVISIAHRPLKKVVKINIHKPVCFINQEWVLAENCQLYDHTLFSSQVINNLLCISCAPDCLEHKEQMLLDIAHNVSDYSRDNYALTVIDKHCIKLIDKNSPYFSIVYSSDQILSPIIFDQCKIVKNNIITHENLDKNIAWIADTRFADYIVAYKA